MLRAVSALSLALVLAGCSMGHVALPFQATRGAPAASEPGGWTKAKTALGGPTANLPARPAAEGPEPGALDLVNELRRNRGLGSLAASAELTHAAQMQAANLARTGTLSHTGPDGSTPLDRALKSGFKAAMAAENVAGGQPTLVEAMRSWRESDTHLRNLLLADATHMGVARVDDPRSPLKTYWTLVIGAVR